MKRRLVIKDVRNIAKKGICGQIATGCLERIIFRRIKISQEIRGEQLPEQFIGYRQGGFRQD
jgi:hypothetical protein